MSAKIFNKKKYLEYLDFIYQNLPNKKFGFYYLKQKVRLIIGKESEIETYFVFSGTFYLKPDNTVRFNIIQNHNLIKQNKIKKKIIIKIKIEILEKQKK